MKLGITILLVCQALGHNADLSSKEQKDCEGWLDHCMKAMKRDAPHAEEDKQLRACIWLKRGSSLREQAEKLEKQIEFDKAMRKAYQDRQAKEAKEAKPDSGTANEAL